MSSKAPPTRVEVALPFAAGLVHELVVIIGDGIFGLVLGLLLIPVAGYVDQARCGGP